MTIRMRKRATFYGEGRGHFEFLDRDVKRVLVKSSASGMIRFIVFVGDTVAGILDCFYDWNGIFRSGRQTGFGMLAKQFFTPVEGVTIEWDE